MSCTRRSNKATSNRGGRYELHKIGNCRTKIITTTAIRLGVLLGASLAETGRGICCRRGMYNRYLLWRAQGSCRCATISHQVRLMRLFQLMRSPLPHAHEPGQRRAREQESQWPLECWQLAGGNYISGLVLVPRWRAGRRGCTALERQALITEETRQSQSSQDGTTAFVTEILLRLAGGCRRVRFSPDTGELCIPACS